MTGAPLTVFDPVREVGKLREHLMAGDKLVSFLFGAGTSSAVIARDGSQLFPLVSGLTAGCEAEVRSLGKKFASAWDAITAGPAKVAWTIEDVLSCVRQMQGAVLPGDTLAGLSGPEISQVEETIRLTISKLVRPDPSNYPDALPHSALARWIKRIDRVHAIEIFTTNYDTLIERSMEQDKVPVYDGFAGSFQPFFHPASLKFDAASPSSDWARLWKVHGSVTWTSRTELDRSVSIIRGAENPTGEMILPSILKYDESRKQPYVAILDRLSDVLEKREDGVLVTAGYSFGDQHINEIVFDALSRNPRLHLFALCYAELPQDNALFKFSANASNVLVYGPKTAIINGKQGVWDVADTVDNRKRLKGIFTFPVPTSGEPYDPQAGNLDLGDFNVFCGMLDQIVGKA